MKLVWGLVVLSVIVGCSDDRPSPGPIRGTGGDGPSDASTDAPVSFPAIPLVGSTPEDGARDVPGTTWVRLDFATELPASAGRGVRLDCGAPTPGFDVDAVGKTTLVVNPRSRLPAGTACTVSFGDAGRVSFTVAGAGAPAVVPYDRNDGAALDPFPDDYYLVADSKTPTGFRVDIRVPTVDSALQGLFAAAIDPTTKLDGMSPLAPIAVRMPDALDPSSVPRTTKESLDPFATIGLFDIDSKSPERGSRVPFDALLRDETDVDGSSSHVLVVFPSVPLRARGRYAFVVTGRALVDPSRPLQASPFFTTVATSHAASADEKRLEPFLTSVLSELRRTSPPLRADDLALALGITVRSVDDIPSDLLSVREQTLAAAPPSFTIVSSGTDAKAGSDVAAVVHGTWSPPKWSKDGKFIDRDADGKPTAGDATAIPFTLALPKGGSGPAPLVMYQHGQPGSSEKEVPQIAGEGFAKAGFAVIGFTDFANREVIPDGNVVTLNTDALVALLTDHQIPDYLSLLTHAEQLAFIRMIPSLGSIDVLPLGAPDGEPDLDPSKPLGYFGISQGSIHGTGLLAFAPEIHAAALTVGAGRFAATLVHQSSEVLYKGIGAVFPTFSHADFYAGLSLVQLDYDHQDPQNLAAHVFREPLALGAPERASILQTEGLGDTEVPFYSVRSGAFALGVPQLAPAAEGISFLTPTPGPVEANVTRTTTAAFFQYVPKGYAAATPSPGCVALDETEGHYCAQVAAEAVRQRVSFFTSALTGVPRISAPAGTQPDSGI